MTEQIITIQSFEHGVTKKKEPMLKITDINGVDYTAFDSGIIANLINCINQTVKLEVSVSGNYKNIRGFNGFSDEAQAATAIKAPMQSTNPVAAPAIVQPAATVEVLEVPKQNSREFGKAGDRVKIYFDTAKDLGEQKAALVLAGLFPIEVELSKEVENAIKAFDKAVTKKAE